MDLGETTCFLTCLGLLLDLSVGLEACVVQIELYNHLLY